MASGPGPAVLGWVAGVLGTGRPEVVRGLRDGASPWLRCDAALCYGAQAPAHVLRGWQEQAGRPADRVAYCDLVAALSSPPDMGWFPLSMALQGRPDLDRPNMLARRDEFLRQALAGPGVG